MNRPEGLGIVAFVTSLRWKNRLLHFQYNLGNKVVLYNKTLTVHFVCWLTWSLRIVSWIEETGAKEVSFTGLFMPVNMLAIDNQVIHPNRFLWPAILCYHTVSGKTVLITILNYAMAEWDDVFNTLSFKKKVF